MNSKPQNQVANPFQKPIAVSQSNAVAASDSERAIQEVQAAMIIAKRFPRDTVRSMDRIINACTRPTLAAGALYSYPRGGQEVTGPSIRLAEAMAQEWGNIQFGIRELSSENGFSTVEAFAWDMETNTRQVKVFQVGHTRFARGELKRLTDPRDIYEMIANQGARRLRACILGVIPGDVTESAVRQCEITQAANIEVNEETIKAMISAFHDNYGVPKELIEKRIGKRVEAINPGQMLNLKKIYQSLKDGMSKPSDWFDVDESDEIIGPKKSDLDLSSKKPAKAAMEPKPEQGKASENDQEEMSEAEAQLRKKIDAARTKNELLKISINATEGLSEFARRQCKLVLDARIKHFENDK